VLVVDDDTGLAKCIEILLSRNGYPMPPYVCTGAEALAELSANEFHLVITDLRLPDADGLRIIAAAREMQTDAPVILMTKLLLYAGVIEALRRGASDYVSSHSIMMISCSRWRAHSRQGALGTKTFFSSAALEASSRRRHHLARVLA
jgi:DNA-binding response OmpR family regulator